MSTQRESQPLPCSNPSVSKHNPLLTLPALQAQHTQGCTLPFRLLPSWTGSGGRRREASPKSSAVLQFLLLKHWFQMVLDTKMEKSKPPCETSFQKKRISLKKEGRCDWKTQPLSRGECLLIVPFVTWHSIKIHSKGTEETSTGCSGNPGGVAEASHRRGTTELISCVNRFNSTTCPINYYIYDEIKQTKLLLKCLATLALPAFVQHFAACKMSSAIISLHQETSPLSAYQALATAKRWLFPGPGQAFQGPCSGRARALPLSGKGHNTGNLI